MIKPAIVISAYNRTESLKRLFTSLSMAKYDYNDIPLIISIDKSDNQEVNKIAEGFEWSYGEKKVINYDNNLGLKKHFLKCGDFTYDYDSIIFLEDDLYVSPYFYNFAVDALNYYNDNNDIAGISLYNFNINETARRPFEPFNDGNDVYFAQLPSWGPIWTKTQWEKFRDWYNDYTLNEDEFLPDNVLKWPETSFKKYYISYLKNNNKYFVYPRSSFITNFSDKGEHYVSDTNVLQTPLIMGEREFSFVRLKDSKAIYDAHLEMLPECLKSFNENLKEYNFEVDIYGKKNLNKSNKEYALTSKKAYESIISFSRNLKPHELDIILNLNGNKIRLCKIKNLKNKKSKRSFLLDDIYYDLNSISIIKLIWVDLFRIYDRIKSIIDNF